MDNLLQRHKSTRPWKNLSHQQRVFAEAYVATKFLDAPAAARTAGYAESTCVTAKTGLLQVPAIQAAINIAKEAQLNRIQVGADDVVTELAQMGFANILDLYNEYGQLIPLKEIPKGLGLAIQSIKESVDQNLNVTTTIKLHNKLDSLKLLAQHIGMLVDRKEISGPNGGPALVAIPQKMTVEEWEAKFG